MLPIRHAKAAGYEDDYDYCHKVFLQTFCETQEGSFVIKPVIAPDVPPHSGRNTGSKQTLPSMGI